MRVVQEILNGVKVIQPQVFSDERGSFCETYNEEKLESLIGHQHFVQDNQSLSQKNVLRGLHFQNPPHAQGKLVRVIKGSVLDVVVDIRKSSSTYGQTFSIVLSEQNFTFLWIPPGFAHGFLTLEDQTIFFYKVTQLYNKSSEDCLIWNDPTLNIDWGTAAPIVSEKDQQGKNFKTFSSCF